MLVSFNSYPYTLVAITAVKIVRVIDTLRQKMNVHQLVYIKMKVRGRNGPRDKYLSGMLSVYHSTPHNAVVDNISHAKLTKSPETRI